MADDDDGQRLTTDYQDVDLSKQQEAMYIESKDNHAMGGVSQA